MSAQSEFERILSEAIDAAFVNYVAEVMTVWFHDNTDQPQRAKTGTDKAITAYLNARTVLGWTEPAPPGQVKMLLHKALDKALYGHVVKLFGVWLHEGGTKQPRALRSGGARERVKNAYLRSYDIIDQLTF